MQKKEYIIPAITRTISVEMEESILAGSVVDSFNEGGVKSAGQAVEEVDFSDDTMFNQDWEE